jgi:uncharacterized protein (TIGR02996 family)
MRSHPDADAFVRAALHQPEDVTARLVFADWLDETGAEHNAAWAQFIRLNIEATRYTPRSDERRRLEQQADEQAPLIRAKLSVPAKLFVQHPIPLLELLPAPNLTVRLAEFELARQVRELMPESLARAHLLLPLDMLRRTFLLAAADPMDSDTAQKLGFILNCHIVLVHAEPEDVRESINRSYGQPELQSVDSVLVEFTDAAADADPFYRLALECGLVESDDPILRLVRMMFLEATNLRADRILLYPDLEAVGLRYRIDNEWVERDRPPRRLHRQIVIRLATLARIDIRRALAHDESGEPLTGEIALVVHHIPYRFGVTILPSPDGATTQINITREPVT